MGITDGQYDSHQQISIPLVIYPHNRHEMTLLHLRKIFHYRVLHPSLRDHRAQEREEAANKEKTTRYYIKGICTPVIVTKRVSSFCDKMDKFTYSGFYPCARILLNSPNTLKKIVPV